MRDVSPTYESGPRLYPMLFCYRKRRHFHIHSFEATHLRALTPEPGATRISE